MIGEFQQTGERHQHPYRYMRYGQLVMHPLYAAFMSDFLRYEYAWLYSEDDAQRVMNAATNRWEWEVADPLPVCKLSDQKKSSCWMPARLMSDWGFEETASPAFAEGAPIIGDKLPSPRRWEHCAKIVPAESYQGGFPLHLLTREQASPLRESHAFIIDTLMTPDGYSHEIKLGLRKVTVNKQSDWRFDDWREVGWELTALVPDEIHSVFAH